MRGAGSGFADPANLGGVNSQFANKLLVEGTVARDLRHSQENFKALAEASQPVLA